CFSIYYTKFNLDLVKNVSRLLGLIHRGREAARRHAMLQIPPLLVHEPPRIDPTAFVAAGARLIGPVALGARASVWYNAVLRADLAPIRIGAETNLQDGALVHVEHDSPCI